MKFSGKTIYCLQALIHLKANPTRYVQADEIARKYSISRQYLQQGLRWLSKHKIVTGKRGATGGFKLAKKKITVYEIMAIIEGTARKVDLDYAPLKNRVNKAFESFMNELKKIEV